MEIEELKIAPTLKRDAYTLYFFLMLWMGTITKCYKTFFFFVSIERSPQN